MLIADHDRERTAERLRIAAGEGRLTTDELDARLTGAFSARTDADLVPLTADLPTSHARHSSPSTVDSVGLTPTQSTLGVSSLPFLPTLAALVGVSILLSGIPVWLLAFPLATKRCAARGRAPRSGTSARLSP